MLLTSFDKYLKERRGVLHVGAHTGEERVWYAEQAFQEVLWFEPNPEIFPILQENLKDYNNQVAFNIGIHDKINNTVLHVASNEGQSSSILDLGLHATYYPKVKYVKDVKIKLMRMDNFLFLSGRNIKQFNFLNVDVQGVELNVIKSFGNLINCLDYVYAEVNEEELYKGCALITEIDYYLAQYRFERVLTKIQKKKWGDAFYVKAHLR